MRKKRDERGNMIYPKGEIREKGNIKGRQIGKCETQSEQWQLKPKRRELSGGKAVEARGKGSQGKCCQSERKETLYAQSCPMHISGIGFSGVSGSGLLAFWQGSIL
jgi:hypothetical protein